MSIWEGKDGYNAIQEFTERTVEELANRDSVVFKRDTRPPKKEILWIKDQLAGIDTVLEFGCGLGTWAPVAWGVACEYTGVDPVKERIEYAKTAHPFGTFFVGDAQTVDLSTKFDVVLFVTVLQHMTLTDALASLRNAVKHLTDDGVIVLMEGRIFDITVDEAERLYADPSCSPHMIPKPLSELKKATPGYQWVQGGVKDRFIIMKED